MVKYLVVELDNHFALALSLFDFFSQAL